jgi:hypothetical protein
MAHLFIVLYFVWRGLRVGRPDICKSPDDVALYVEKCCNVSLLKKMFQHDFFDVLSFTEECFTALSKLFQHSGTLTTTTKRHYVQHPKKSNATSSIDLRNI